MPRASNLLRERERHIQLLLSDELFPAQAMAPRSPFQTASSCSCGITTRTSPGTSKSKIRWAVQLEKDWTAGLARIGQLQDEPRGATRSAGTELARKYDVKVGELDEESRQKTQWARGIEDRFTAKAEELAETVRHLDWAEATVI